MSWNLDEAISYYRTQGAPADQNALIRLLREIQQEQGGCIPEFTLTAVASAYAIKPGLLLALIRRIPSLRLGTMPVLELCAGPNCSKQAQLASYAEKLQSRGKLTLRYVPCMRMCGKGPNLRWNGKLYHRATIELLEQLID